MSHSFIAGVVSLLSIVEAKRQDRLYLKSCLIWFLISRLLVSFIQMSVYVLLKPRHCHVRGSSNTYIYISKHIIVLETITVNAAYSL